MVKAMEAKVAIQDGKASPRVSIDSSSAALVETWTEQDDGEEPVLALLPKGLREELRVLVQRHQEDLVSKLEIWLEGQWTEPARAHCSEGTKSEVKSCGEWSRRNSQDTCKRTTLWDEEEAKKKEARRVSSKNTSATIASTSPDRSKADVFIKTIVHSMYFESVFCSLIIANTLFLGIETEYVASHLLDTTPLPFLVISKLFIFLFTVELILRMVANKCVFFYGQDACWNLFDFLLVSVSLLDLVLGSLHAGTSEASDTENLTFIRMVRILRIVRVFRIFRLMRFFRSLRILVFSVLNTLKSLFWTMCLLVSILFIFGVIFTQAVLQHLTVDHGSADAWEALLPHYGTLFTTILTLFKTITGGVTWQEVLHPLWHLHWLYSSLFIVYVAFMYFAVLNVVTGVFCEAAIGEAQDEKDEAVAYQLENKSKLVSRLQAIFRDLDGDDSGTITIDEFEQSLHDERLKAYFASLDLNVSDAWSLFKLLDSNGSHIVGIDEFVTGCLRLIGNAKSVDIAMLSYESRWMIERFVSFSESMDLQLFSLREEVKSLLRQWHESSRDGSKLPSKQSVQLPQQALLVQPHPEQLSL